MAASIDGMRYVESPVGDQLLPGGEEAQVQWPAPLSPTLRHHEEYDEDRQDAKKSALAKLKERVRKWKQILVNKKHGRHHHHNDNEERYGTPLQLNESRDGDPEYHGAPMYESERASSFFKGMHAQPRNPTLHKRSRAPLLHYPERESELKLSFDTHKEPELHHLNAFKENSSTQDDPNVRSLSILLADKPLTELVLEILAPVYTGLKEIIYSKGVLAKDYLINILQPGEEDRVLSQLITEMISVHAGEVKGMAVMEKVKEVFSLLPMRDERTKKLVPASTDPREVEMKNLMELSGLQT